MYYLLNNIVYVCVLTIYYLIAKVLKINIKINKWLIVVVSLLYQVEIIVALDYFEKSFYIPLPFIGFIICAGCILGRITDKLKYSVLFTMIYLLLGEVSNTLFISVDGYVYRNESYYLYNDFTYIQDYLFVILFLGILYLLLKGKNNVKDKISRKMNAFIYAVLTFMEMSLALTVSFTKYILIKYVDDDMEIFFYVISIMSFIGLVIILLVIVYIVNVNKKVNYTYEQEKILKETQEIFYKALLDKEEDTRKFRHDITGHMICMRNLLEEGNISEATEYLEKMNEAVKLIAKSVYISDNKHIDALTNYYLGQLNHNINVEITGHLENNLSVSAYDLSVIYSNMLKNAVEELNGCDEGYIKINFAKGKQYTRIEMENSLNMERLGKKKWDKSEECKHGYGLKNMEEAVKKYNGSVETDKDENRFKIAVTF